MVYIIRCCEMLIEEWQGSG